MKLNWCKLASALLLSIQIPLGFATSESEPLQRIAFGSCSNQDKPQPIWKANKLAPPSFTLPAL